MGQGTSDQILGVIWITDWIHEKVCALRVLLFITKICLSC